MSIVEQLCGSTSMDGVQRPHKLGLLRLLPGWHLEYLADRATQPKSSFFQFLNNTVNLLSLNKILLIRGIAFSLFAFRERRFVFWLINHLRIYIRCYIDRLVDRWHHVWLWVKWSLLHVNRVFFRYFGVFTLDQFDINFLDAAPSQ